MTENTHWLALVIMLFVASIALFVWAVVLAKRGERKKISENLVASAEGDIERIFNEEFREELRNRGRLHFENILNENAMFLQQDLRLTTSEVNEYMKSEILKILKEEFKQYEQSIVTARDQAIESIRKTQSAIEQQRQTLEGQMKEEIKAEKQKAIAEFDARMADVINHYILEALGGEIDLSSQMDFIFSHLETNKQAIIEDIKSGA